MVKLNDKAIAVEVLKGSVDHEIYDGSFYYVSDESYYDSPSADKRYKIDLPEGNWQILGLAHELTEEQCEGVVDSTSGLDHTNDYIHFDYNDNDWGYATAKESFQSLMESHGLVFENPMGTNDDTGHNARDREWREAQQKVKTYLILTKND